MDNSIAWQNELLMSDAENRHADASSSEKADAMLVELVLAGDETAFQDIFERHKRSVALAASRYFRQPEQIEEVVQISFAKAYFDLSGFRGDHDFSLASWLGKITTNVCLDRLKKQKRRPENSISEFSESENENILAELADSNLNAETDLVRRDLAEKLLSQLPPADRALLQMLYAEEMSAREISAVTGWSSANVKVRAYRARRSLRKILRRFL